MLSSIKKVNASKILSSIYQLSLPEVPSQQRVFRRRKVLKTEEQKEYYKPDLSFKKSPRKVIPASKEEEKEAPKQQSLFLFPERPKVLSQIDKVDCDGEKASLTKGPSKKSNKKVFLSSTSEMIPFLLIDDS